MDPRSLPIWKLHADLLQHLTSNHQLVVVAATGSGKTTQVPQMILDAGLAGSRQVVVLQPRRVAARSVAARVAFERRSKLGHEVGYQIRFEDRSSLGTRICFITEGILLRWIQDDPTLPHIGVLIFDEFHERNLLSDVGLALAKQLQHASRPDLRIVVMSATMDAAPVARYLSHPPPPASPSPTPATDAIPPAPILSSDGRTFPVEIRWADYHDQRPVTEQAADAVETLIRAGESGDILVFMPGMSEIVSTVHAIRSAAVDEPIAILPLHGDLPPEEQDRVFQPDTRRKIIIATNVAETSITIDGIRHVVDSGLARIARYDPDRGLQTLAIEEISRASADQRAGRAGRTDSGVCWRLWTESNHLNRADRNTPEIQRSDLAEVVLLLHSLGIRHATEFDWLDRPDPDSVRHAENLLITLGALAAPATPRSGEPTAPRGTDLTPIGRQMLRLPMHPRFSRMLVEAAQRGCVPAAAQCAALVSGRDLLLRAGREDTHLREAREVFEASNSSDFHTLMRAHQYARNARFATDACRRMGIHAATARNIEDTFQQMIQIVRREGLLKDAPPDGPEIAPDADALARCVLAGFLDQVARRRNAGTLDCDLPGGRQGALARDSVVQDASFLVVASIREISGRGGTVTLLTQATAINPEWLAEMFPQHLSETVEHLFDPTHKRVAAVRVRRFFDLVLDHQHLRETDPKAAGACLAAAWARGLFDLPRLDHAAQQFIARVNLVALTLPELGWKPLDRPALQACLATAFQGLTLARDARETPLLASLRTHLKSGEAEWLDELAPVSIAWPPGKSTKLHYPADDDGPRPPEAQIKITDCLQARDHPAVLEGRTPVLVILTLPDGKRLEATPHWPDWREKTYPKHKSALQKRFSSLLWP